MDWTTFIAFIALAIAILGAIGWFVIENILVKFCEGRGRSIGG